MPLSWMPPEGLVYRTKPWPVDDLRGEFLLAGGLTHTTGEILRQYRQLGSAGHEGMVFWAGRQFDDTTAFIQVIAPSTDHGRGHVSADREAVGLAARKARGQGLAILAQVHSHPGADARHSDGDDDLILLPFAGMLSVVVPDFGEAFSTISGACVHQYQDGQWVLCSPESVRKRIREIPIMEDLR